MKYELKDFMDFAEIYLNSPVEVQATMRACLENKKELIPSKTVITMLYSRFNKYPGIENIYKKLISDYKNRKTEMKSYIEVKDKSEPGMGFFYEFITRFKKKYEVSKHYLHVGSQQYELTFKVYIDKEDYDAFKIIFPKEHSIVDNFLFCRIVGDSKRLHYLKRYCESLVFKVTGEEKDAINSTS